MFNKPKKLPPYTTLWLDSIFDTVSVNSYEIPTKDDYNNVYERIQKLEDELSDIKKGCHSFQDFVNKNYSKAISSYKDDIIKCKSMLFRILLLIDTKKTLNDIRGLSYPYSIYFSYLPFDEIKEKNLMRWANVRNPLKGKF